MDTTWLDGWVGAVIAAAVTVGATVSWEARARRRALLDEALVSMAAAADELGMAVLMWAGNEAAPLVRPLLTAQLRATALASRPVGVVPAKFAAPARWRMSRHLEGVMGSLGDAIGEIDDEHHEPRAAVAALCGKSSMIALLWWRRPLAFLRKDPLSAVDDLGDTFAAGIAEIIAPPS